MSEDKFPEVLTQDNCLPSASASAAVCTTVRRMAMKLTEKNSRSSFFSSLSQEVAAWYPFDRLSINLYDSESEVLCFFTAAEGTVVSALSTLREANQNTVAGRVINSKKPVVISNLLTQFHGELSQPMTDAGLNCTMAFPLIENKHIIGTLHCSFAEEPSYFMELIDFFAEIVPFVTIFLSHVLATERLQTQKNFVPLAHLPGAAASQEVVLFDTEAMREVMSIVNSVTALDVPIFITGETGTGKTLMAKYIHENSPRSGRHFIKVNCPSIAPTLIESELFGHIRGSFTGASGNRMGRIEMANQGTLFLDEVAELQPDMQSKLLQVIEEKAFERVGESSPTSVDFRLISATNKDIAQAVKENKLRRDFYYRLAAVNITLPPLRQREDDIPILFEFMTNRQASSLGLPQLTLPSKLMNELRNYSWPGNIREMRNVINRLLIQNIRQKITLESLREAMSANSLDIPVETPGAAPDNGLFYKAMPQHSSADEELNGSYPSPGQEPGPNSARSPENDEWDEAADAGTKSGKYANGPDSLKEIERKHIAKVIKECRGVIAGPDGAAARLGLPRSTLQHRMRKLGIQG